MVCLQYFKCEFKMVTRNGLSIVMLVGGQKCYLLLIDVALLLENQLPGSKWMQKANFRNRFGPLWFTHVQLSLWFSLTLGQ